MIKPSIVFVLSLFLFCFQSLFAQSNSPIDELRESLKGDISKERLDEMLLELDEDDSDLALGYKGVIYFLRSKEAFLPTTKYKYFSKGCTYLDKAIEQSPENCELRYLRLVFQHEIPSFLGYDEAVEEDFRYFVKELDTVEPDLYNDMRLSLISLDKLSREKKNILKKL
jgi:hypothetical protein